MMRAEICTVGMGVTALGANREGKSTSKLIGHPIDRKDVRHFCDSCHPSVALMVIVNVLPLPASLATVI